MSSEVGGSTIDESKAGGVSDAGDEASKYAISLDSIKAAHARIASHVHRTPVMTSTAMDELCGGRHMFFKCELFQKTGSFKARGATNAVLSLSDELAAKGVVTESSGNHGQAVAWAAKQRGIAARIVMPDDAPAIKVRAVQGYGAVITQVPPEERSSRTKQVVEETGMTLVHPSNDPDVMSGQGTMALELLEQIPALAPRADGTPAVDAVIVPIGGGGMTSGVAMAVKTIDPRIKVYAAEPAACDDAARSKEAGSIQGNTQPIVTVADGLRTVLGSNTWPIVRDLVDGVIVVSEEEIVTAMRHVWERMKLCIEPSAGTGVAVAMSPQFDALVGDDVTHVAVILCGGNVDLNKLPWSAK